MAPKGEFTNESSSLVFQPPEFDDDASRLKAEDRDVEVVVRVDLFQLLEDPGWHRPVHGWPLVREGVIPGLAADAKPTLEGAVNWKVRISAWNFQQNDLPHICAQW